MEKGGGEEGVGVRRVDRARRCAASAEVKGKGQDGIRHRSAEPRVAWVWKPGQGRTEKGTAGQVWRGKEEGG